ncbi:MAG: hypothetical protein ACYDAB_01915 [bacterium]
MSEPEPAQKYPQLKSKLERLHDLAQQHHKIVGRMIEAATGNLYYPDFVIMAILQRSLDILDATSVLIARWNFNAVAPLLRMQVDNLLKLFYLARCENPIDIAQAMLSDKPLYRFADEKGRRLTDARLRAHARRHFPWLDDVYKETSRMIHLSDKHFFNTIESVSEDDRSVVFRIRTGAPHWPPQEIGNFLDSTITTTEAVLNIADGYATAKTTFHPTAEAP